MLSDRGAVIVGGARGIGEACAWDMLRNGADVVLADINAERLETVAEQMQAEYPKRTIHTFRLDVRQQAECFALAEFAAEQLNTIDIFVNAAGIISPCPSLEVTQDDWVNLININLNGVFFCCQAAGRVMQNRGGVIINISSIAARAAWPQRVSYAAAKTGITGITESLAVEWAPLGIRVNAVAPAWTNTELMQSGVERGVVAIESLKRAIPLGRIAEVEDIANMVTFLASDRAGYVTGQTIYVDGGYLVGAPPNAIR